MPKLAVIRRVSYVRVGRVGRYKSIPRSEFRFSVARREDVQRTDSDLVGVTSAVGNALQVHMTTVLRRLMDRHTQHAGLLCVSFAHATTSVFESNTRKSRRSGQLLTSAFLTKMISFENDDGGVHATVASKIVYREKHSVAVNFARDSVVCDLAVADSTLFQYVIVHTVLSEKHARKHAR